MRLDGYVRVSQVRGRGGESFISPDLQRQAIERWAAAHNVEIAAWHTDLDQSGAKRSRPGFDTAMSRIRNRETDGIIVAKLDRFFRSLAGALGALREIEESGAAFVSVADNIDLSTPTGRAFLRILLVFAELEWERTRDNWAVAQREAVSRGIHIASRTPTGYLKGTDGRLEPHPEHASAITEAFRMRAGRASWREICDHLDRRGVVGPYEATHWTTKAVNNIIRNRVYLGEARSGDNVKAGAHQPLTDPITWERAQRATSAPPARREPALLSGLMRCAGCRFVMKADWMTLRTGAKQRIYRCRGRHSTGLCPDRAAVSGNVIEPWVEARYFDLIRGATMHSAAVTQDLSDLQAAVHEAEAEMVAFRDDARIRALGQDVYVEGLQGKVEAIEEARRALADARGDAPVDVPDVVELEAMWPTVPVLEKQKLLGAVISAVMLRSGRSLPIDRRALILWRGELPDDFPRRGKRGPIRSFTWPPDGAGVDAP